ncbi:putative integral membrane [Diaporthe ampelina]|uniref:Putative integral membrane n=1 Tax=Diaporthe ampelina TaxID=1214573 RepID=A0A0G2I5Z7_9PEZI|nr:putative integral membrane [Diaporthe ampelina]
MSSQSPEPVKVTTFTLQGRVVGYTLGAALMALLSRRAFIAPGSIIYETLIKTPEAAQTAYKIQDWAFLVVVGAHALEALLFAATKLRKHGVPFLSLLWWKWVLGCFVGGGAAWMHFAQTVAAAEGKRT